MLMQPSHVTGQGQPCIAKAGLVCRKCLAPIACLIIPVIPVRLHKASTTARLFMHTLLTVRAYSYHPHKQANTKAAHMLTPITTVNLHFLHHVLISAQFNHFTHALWVAVRCEASGASEATHTVAVANGATCIL